MTSERTRRLAAVFFADIVGYTDLSSRDEEAALKVVDELQRFAREEVEARGGRIVKFVGDAVLAVFDSADAALRSALALQDAFSRSDVVNEHDCALSTGLHLGEVVQADDGDVYGDGVNIAARIEGQAGAGQVVVSEDVHRLLRQQAEHSFKPFGPVKLKGVEEPMWLYVVGAPGSHLSVTLEPPVPDSTALYNAITRHWPKIAVGSIGAAVGAGFAFGRIAGVSFQSYAFAWAATTSGLWFLFDKAETAMSARSRKQVVGWLRETNLRSGFESIPAHFAMLFDWIFGEKHVSLRCFGRSFLATFAALTVLVAVLAATRDALITGQTTTGVVVSNSTVPPYWLILMLLLINVLGDYLSLLETRWAIGRMVRTQRVARTLVLDLFLTGGIWATAMPIVLGLVVGFGGGDPISGIISGIVLILISPVMVGVYAFSMWSPGIATSDFVAICDIKFEVQHGLFAE